MAIDVKATGRRKDTGCLLEVLLGSAGGAGWDPRDERLCEKATSSL